MIFSPKLTYMTTETKKPTKWATCFVIFIAMSIIATCVIICSDPTPSAESDKHKELTREERIKKAFHPWDGAHINLERWVKKSMNDPNSYEHVETRFREATGDSVFIIMTFRGKNAFGGVVKNTVTCWTDLDGNIISVPKTL